MSNKDLATHIARKIFEVGSDGNMKAIRIQFRCRRGGREIGLGGFIETALANFIEKTLNEVSGSELNSND